MSLAAGKNVEKDDAPGSLDIPSVLHPRGRIKPPLPKDAPIWRRVARGVYRLVQGLYIHDAFNAAPAMAFHFFLSLLPLLVFIGYLVGAVVQSRGADVVLAPVLENLPPTAESVVRKESERLAGASTLGPLAAVGFLWVAAGGTHGLMDSLEVVVGAPRRSWWKKRALAIGWVVASLAVIAALSYLVIGWDAVFHRDGRPMAATLALAISALVSTITLAVFFRFSVSHPRRVRRRTLPGAALAVVLWLVISWGFGLYVRSLASYAVFYGSLAAVAVLLMWLWLTSLAILVGAELNVQLEGLRD